MSRNNILSGKSFAGYDSLFGDNDTISSDNIVMLPINQLQSFHNHPFKVKDDEKMQETIESIRSNGVLVPVIARKIDENSYELISGHRRKYACESLGITTIPTIIRDVDDDEATIIMVDANLQREHIDYSEKAYALKLKYEALKHQGCKGLGDSADKVGQESGESGRQIRRYIRLTELIPPLLELVDAKKIKFNTAVELSYLSQKSQQELYEIISKTNIYPSQKQTLQLKDYDQRGELTSACIEIVLNSTVEKQPKLIIKMDKIQNYFSPGTTMDEIESIIITLLEQWNK